MSLFVARRTRCDQMRGRRRETTGGVVTVLRRGLCHAENNADGHRSDAAVEEYSWMGSGGWKG